MEGTDLHLPHIHLPSRREAHPESWGTQLRWYALAAAAGFVVPLVGSSILGLQHDLYLGVYFVAVGSLLWAYASATRLDVRAVLARNWKLGVAFGVVVGLMLVRNVFSEHATPRPSGVYYWFELIWRGGVYGAFDALLLTVLPCLVVYRSLGGRLPGWRLRLEYVGAALALIVTLTAIYHLGYRQYRQDGVRAPETGNLIISVPMLLSANPIGSVADHMAMHISAVQHEYNTEVRLPPPTKAR
jgi:NADH:ubiquinone oxidoreductase subunit 6 (subunit J)